MANTDNPNGFSLARSITGQMAPVSLPLAASQSIKKGDALIWASGLVAIAVPTSPQLLGFAAEAARPRRHHRARGALEPGLRPDRRWRAGTTAAAVGAAQIGHPSVGGPFPGYPRQKVQ